MTYPNQRTVKITKGGKTATCVFTAYEKVWKPRGWKLVDEKVAGAAKDTGSDQSNTEKKEGAK